MTMRSPLLAAVATGAIVFLAACSTESATEPTAEPTLTPTATLTPTPTPTATPTETAAAEYEMCSNDFLVDMMVTSGDGIGSNYDEILELMDPQPGFAPAGLVTGADVLCAATVTMPVGETAAMVSVAIVNGPTEPVTLMEDWLADNGYTVTGFPEYALPSLPDGRTTQKVSLTPYGYELLAEGRLELHESLLGFDLDDDDILVLHYDFTPFQ